MRIVTPGRPDKTGKRQVECKNCEATIEITGGDFIYVEAIIVNGHVIRPGYYILRCPECGWSLETHK